MSDIVFKFWGKVMLSIDLEIDVVFLVVFGVDFKIILVDGEMYVC